MDAGTNIKLRLQGRQGATDLHWLFAAVATRPHDVSAHHEIFKKTPFVSGLHSVGRDAVKDIPEIASIPLLTTTMLDQDIPPVFAGWMIAEKTTAVTPTAHQGVLRSAEWTAPRGDVVGATGNQVIDASFTVMAFEAGASNGKLTDSAWDARTSRRAACATNDWTGIDAEFAELNRFVDAGASRCGGDLENHRYANI